MKNVKKNYIYNISFQILKLILPLVTVPYVSRTIGASGIGQYSYTYSIMYYFMIFAMLGLNNYGNRSVAKVRDNKEELSKTFKEIYIMQVILSSSMLVLYFIYIFVFNPEYKLIAVIQSLYILSCIFDINWFFFGMEKFKLTVARNSLIKLISLICIFVFVKHSNDIWIYTLILSGGTLISQLLLWPFVKKYVDLKCVKKIEIHKHFIPCLKLFLPVVAVTIYKMMDKTMLGLFCNIKEVGYYENAEKIIAAPIVVIDALGTVMLPRMTNMYSKGDNENAKSLIEKSMIFIMFLSLPIFFGLVGVSKTFSLLYFGNEFIKAGKLMQLLSITIILLGWGNVIRTQYLIPKERDKEYIISAFLGAIVNLLMNLIFIPKIGSIGACYGTILAELIVVVYQTYSVRKELMIKKYILSSIPFAIKGFAMLTIINFIELFYLNAILKLVLQIILGILIYFILNFNYIYKLLKLNLKLKKQ